MGSFCFSGKKQKERIMNENKLFSFIINKVTSYVKNIMGIILDVSYIINDNTIIIDYIGGSKGYTQNYIDKYFMNFLDGIIMEINNINIKLNYISFDYIKKGIQLKISYIIIENYLSYFDVINNDVLAEIISNLNKKQDIINLCNIMKINICLNNDLYYFIMFKKYPEIMEEIRKIEIIDGVNYSKLLLDFYLLLLEKGVIILTSSNNVTTSNELFYRLKFYLNHPGVYPKVNSYMNKELFIDIMKSYSFPYLGANNIYSIYSTTGIINVEYCENYQNYMNTESINIEMVISCIGITNNKLARFQKAIMPWIQINDILTWFMLIDLKKEVNTIEELQILREILIQKYKSTKFFAKLLDAYDKQ